MASSSQRHSPWSKSLRHSGRHRRREADRTPPKLMRALTLPGHADDKLCVTQAMRNAECEVGVDRVSELGREATCTASHVCDQPGRTQGELQLKMTGVIGQPSCKVAHQDEATFSSSTLFD